MLGAAAALLLLTVFVIFRLMQREQRLAERLEAVQRLAGLDQVHAPRPLAGLPVRMLAGLGAMLTRGSVLPARTIRELEQTLLAAGFRGDRALAVFVGAKIAGLCGLPMLAALLLDLGGVAQPWWSYAVVGAAILGMLLPDVTARRLRRRYLVALERGLPDALDLLIICTEAGLSLEAAIGRVAEEIRPANAAVATEFALCASELRILPDRRTALTNMAARTGLDLARRLAMTLTQTMQFGTPLAQALRTLAGEMRQEQLARFEARAARLPVLLTIPMILCILPTLFLVIVGPVALQVLRLW